MTPVDVVVTSYLEPELVTAIAAVDESLRVLYDPALVPAPRYASDHGGTRPELDDAAQRTWEEWLGRARIAFDFDWQDPAGLPRRAPHLEWVQATSAGIGSFVTRTGLDRTDLVLTTAAGVHGRPLAEFALTGVLHFVKGVPYLRAQQREHRWERYTTRSAAGLHAVVIGLGSLGRSTCDLLGAVGLRVTGVGRPGRTYNVPSAAAVVSTDDLDDVVTGADVVVLACPLTPETEGILSRARLERLAPGAVVVNIARGQCLDEAALLEGLATGRLGGAALDVFGVEPLPADSPFWDRDDVVVSPHSASTLASENASIVDLFCRNLRAWLDGRPLTNVYRRDLGY
ncbi:D-2-hydroxyacid dehydrogenase [Jatrophihabitans sp. YIM 134969]